MSSYYPITGIQDGLDPNHAKPLREVPVRMEVDEWYTSQDLVHINQRALFFPAFWKFSQMDPHEKLSWFQIAGIHGQPFIAWDEPPRKGVVPNKGYCTHNSILFSTWHRPYMLLWEQVIWELMLKEVDSYPADEQPALREAANSWRFPYWDWALKKPVDGSTDNLDYNVPLVIRDQKVRIRLPTIDLEGEYPNAFYQFTMPKEKGRADKMKMGSDSLGSDDKPLEDLRIKAILNRDEDVDYKYPYDQCTGTSRHPTATSVTQAAWVDGSQDNDAIAKDLRDYKWDPVHDREDSRFGNMTASLRDAFYRLTTIEKFEDFATKRAPGYGAKKANLREARKPHAFDSAENLHDNVHGWCGGDEVLTEKRDVRLLGHMSNVPVAAYDPIFWLHHCNVDRLIAIWQILHSTSWFDDNDVRNEDAGTFAIEFEHKDKPSDELKPFRKNANGEYWTSDAVANVTALGYTYPQLEKWQHLDSNGEYNKDAHLDQLREYLNRNYNSAWTAAEKSELTPDPQQDAAAPVPLGSLDSIIKVTGKKPVDLTIDDYVVDVVYEKFALRGKKFTVHVFIGEVPSDLPYTFGAPGTQVGQVINFSSEPPADESSPGCGNCQKQLADHTKSTGRVVLTNALITRWKNQIVHSPADPAGPAVLADMTPPNVVEFLKHNLHWRVTSLGRIVDPEQIPSVKVTLAVGKADHFKDRSKMSRFYDYKAAYEVTQGRPNGANPEDDELYPPGFEYSPE